MVQQRFETHKNSLPRRSKLSLELMDDHRLMLADFEMLRVRTQQGTNGRSSSILFDRLAKSLGEHFVKEERLLFPLLNRYLGATICNQLSTENTEMISLAKHQREQGSLSEESFSKLEKLLQTHVSTEENVLFWYLDVQHPTD
jgi:iron-sulfur cluster repair protein YtfE (RIC family)